MGLIKLLAEEGIIPWNWGTIKVPPNSCELAWQCISQKLKNMKERDFCIASILSVAVLLWYVASRFDDDDDDDDSDSDEESPNNGGKRSVSVPEPHRPAIDKDAIEKSIEDTIDGRDSPIEAPSPGRQNIGNDDKDGGVKPTDDEKCPPSIVSSERTPSQDETTDSHKSRTHSTLDSASHDTWKDTSGLSYFRTGDSRRNLKKNSKDDSQIVDKVANNIFYFANDDHLYNAQVVARAGSPFGHRKPHFNLKSERLSANGMNKFHQKGILRQEIMKKTTYGDDNDKMQSEETKSKLKKNSQKSIDHHPVKRALGSNNNRREF